MVYMGRVGWLTRQVPAGEEPGQLGHDRQARRAVPACGAAAAPGQQPGSLLPTGTGLPLKSAYTGSNQQRSAMASPTPNQPKHPWGCGEGRRRRSRTVEPKAPCAMHCKAFESNRVAVVDQTDSGQCEQASRRRQCKMLLTAAHLAISEKRAHRWAFISCCHACCWHL